MFAKGPWGTLLNGPNFETLLCVMACLNNMLSVEL